MLSALPQLLAACPCLHAQLDVGVPARAVVHLCEVTLGVPIDSTNVYDAFLIQHPKRPAFPYRFPPGGKTGQGGGIMEALCGEVLTNHGIPHMATDTTGWPVWSSPAHVTLNAGRFAPLKMYGDFLIPAAPHNILVSVKSEAARERLLVSGNRLESVGFGFFDQASEFWTQNRMNLYKRWGFVAIYLPGTTHTALMTKLATTGRTNFAVNINGKPLYRPLREFGPDMLGIAGKVSSAL